jgi:hypothetical protein
MKDALAFVVYLQELPTSITYLTATSVICLHTNMIGAKVL